MEGPRREEQGRLFVNNATMDGFAAVGSKGPGDQKIFCWFCLAIPVPGTPRGVFETRGRRRNWQWMLQMLLPVSSPREIGRQGKSAFTVDVCRSTGVEDFSECVKLYNPAMI